MSTIRVKRRDRDKFTIIERDAINDSALSFRARGILAWLLDKPADWQTSSDQLAKKAPEGREAIRTALRELETAGYLRRPREQDGQGRWRTTWVVYEVPVRPTDAQEPDVGSPDASAPVVLPETVTEDCHREEDSPSPSEPTVLADRRAKTPRARDLLWDALVAAWTGDANRKLSRSEAGRVAAAKKQLVELDATPEQVRVAADRMRRQWGNAGMVTPTSIVANWSQFAPERTDTVGVDGAVETAAVLW